MLVQVGGRLCSLLCLEVVGPAGHGAAGQAGLSLQEVTLASSWKKQSLALGKQFRPCVMEVRGHLDRFFCRACSWHRGSCPSPDGMCRNGLARVTLSMPRPQCWSKDTECAGLEVEQLKKLFLFHPILCFLIHPWGCGVVPATPVFTWGQLIQPSYKCLVLFSLNRA